MGVAHVRESVTVTVKNNALSEAASSLVVLNDFVTTPARGDIEIYFIFVHQRAVMVEKVATHYNFFLNSNTYYFIVGSEHPSHIKLYCLLDSVR